MTSTNHFRKRKLAGSQRSLVRAPCHCIPATTPPPIPAQLTISNDWNCTDGVLTATVAARTDQYTNDVPGHWQCTFISVEGYPVFVEVFYNNPGGIFVLYTNVNWGGGFVQVTNKQYPWDGTTPYSSGPQNVWNDNPGYTTTGTVSYDITGAWPNYP